MFRLLNSLKRIWMSLEVTERRCHAVGLYAEPYTYVYIYERKLISHKQEACACSFLHDLHVCINIWGSKMFYLCASIAIIIDACHYMNYAADELIESVEYRKFYRYLLLLFRPWKLIQRSESSPFTLPALMCWERLCLKISSFQTVCYAHKCEAIIISLLDFGPKPINFWWGTLLQLINYFNLRV